MVIIVGMSEQTFTASEHCKGGHIDLELRDHSNCGVSIQLTYDNAERLSIALAQLCQDRQRQAHPEATAGGQEILSVDDVEATVPTEEAQRIIRQAMHGG